MEQRQLGPFHVSCLGLGCMNLSHAYGAIPSVAEAEALLLSALDRGVTHFDTAALYGFGANEELLGRVLGPQRGRFVLASKCGLHGVDGKRVLDGRPETLAVSCEQSLKRLRTDTIDLFYLHRWDRGVPIEDSVGALSELVKQGKVKTIGLSEVSAATLRKAHAVHPITAVQSEYSLWTRNPERGVLAACHELGVTFVAFSPLGRGFLTGALRDVTDFAPKDIRRNMPRFQADNYARNLALVDELSPLARELECSLPQLALAWLLAKGEHIIPIFGTRSLAHLEDNLGAASIQLTYAQVACVERALDADQVVGARYSEAGQADIDTEEW